MVEDKMKSINVIKQFGMITVFVSSSSDTTKNRIDAPAENDLTVEIHAQTPTNTRLFYGLCEGK